MKNNGFLFFTIIAIVGLSITACKLDGGDPPPLIEMVWVPAGTFTMGQDGISGATPHQVTLTRGFYMAKTQVTQKEYFDVMGGGPMATYQPTVTSDTNNYGRGDNYPMYYVSWYNAIEFCNALSDREGLTRIYTISGSTVTLNWSANGYRLPTEAEWEYACRAETNTPWSHNESLHDEYMWFIDNASSTAQPVGTKQANPWGLFDMHGNLWEWCWDLYDVYPGSGPRIDPVVSKALSASRVNRGGGWNGPSEDAHSANRNIDGPGVQFFNMGFRVARRP